MTWQQAEEAMHGGAIVRRASWHPTTLGVVERGERLFYGQGRSNHSPRHREYRPSFDAARATDWLVEDA